MISRILLIVLGVVVLNTVSGCTFDFVNLDTGTGGRTAHGTGSLSGGDSLSRDNPWDDDWPYRWRGYRRYGSEP